MKNNFKIFFIILFCSKIVSGQECDIYEYCIKKYLGENYDYALINNLKEEYTLKKESAFFKKKALEYFSPIEIDSINTMIENIKYGKLDAIKPCSDKWKMLSKRKVLKVFERNKKLNITDLISSQKHTKNIISIFHFSPPIYYSEYIIIESSTTVTRSWTTSSILLFRYVNGKIIYVDTLYSSAS